MADSDHSMRLSVVTRRMAFGGGLVGAIGWVLRDATLAHGAVSQNTAADPALSLWRDVKAVHLRAEQLYRRMQELEMELADRADFPGTVVRIPGGDDVFVCSKEGLDRLVGDRTDLAALRARAEAELDAQQAHFDAVASEIGYFAGLKDEQAAFAQLDALLEALSTTPAASLAGVAGKLDAVIREGKARDDCLAFPWPQIRSARDDLLRIGPEMPSGACFREFGPYG